jgi:hypothetical protein
MTPDYAWTHREGRKARFEAKRIGGTIVDHFIKKILWYLETALALLDGGEQLESEKYESASVQLTIPPPWLRFSSENSAT